MVTMGRPLSVLRTERLAVRKPSALEQYFTLSPFVWKTDVQFEMLLRVVNPSADASQKVARIHHATSRDGLTFQMSERASISPGPSEEDLDGCEDPSLAVVDEYLHVYYSGWNQQRKKSELLYACGTDADGLVKIGVALRSYAPFENPKEATIVRGGDGVWNLFFEYSCGGASQIGLAKSDAVSGPWTTMQPKTLSQRSDSWDDWHLSPGPICQIGGHNYMFYNGATRDPKWRVGWISFDDCFEKVVGRCGAPIIAPPPPRGDETDIAFSASLVRAADALWLYYSVADKYLYRAIVAWE